MRDMTPLRTLRLERGWTQKELARRAGMCKQQIQRYESYVDLSCGTHRNLAAIAEALGVAVDDLLPPKSDEHDA